MPDMTPERERAERIQQTYAATVARIRSDHDLTDEARGRRLAEAWRTTRAKLDELRTAEQTRLAKREQELERKLFGTGWLDGASEAISNRDAQDRASRLARSDEATRLLRRAEQNGDQALARAIAHHALQQSRQAPSPQASRDWDSVVGAFLDARPHTAPVVEELAMIERLGTRQVFSPFSLPQPNGVAPEHINAASMSPAGAA